MVGGEEFLAKSTLAKEVDFERWRFKLKPEKFELVDSNIYSELNTMFRPFMDDDILDIVERKNAGTGSNNLKRYYFLVGPTPVHDAAKTHIVEVKQQREAAPIKYFPNLSANNRLTPAHLTVNCQRKMQRRPDIILDDVKWQGRYWLIRSRHHSRVGIDSKHIVLGNKAANANGLVQYARSCAVVLALAHMRGDRRSIDFQSKISSTLASNELALFSSAGKYVQQVLIDWKLMKALIGK